MASSIDYKDFIMEQLANLHPKCRPMTGEFLVYVDGIYFEDTRNTSCEDLMIKLRYVLTVLSKLYYNKIDEQEYIELVSILDIA